MTQKSMNLTPSNVSQRKISKKATMNNVSQSQMSKTSTPGSPSGAMQSESVNKRKFQDSDESIIFETEINTDNFDLKKIKIEPSEDEEDLAHFINDYE